MAKIETLTDAQKAKFPEFIETWTRIGLSTEPADRPRAEAAIRKMYEIAGKKEPRVIWCASPMSMALTRAIVQKVIADRSIGASVGASIRASVWASVWASVRASIGDSVWDSVRDSIGDSIGASVGASIGASVGDSIGDSVWDSIGASVGDSIGDSIGASVGDSVGASVWDSVGDSVWASVVASVRASIGDSVWDSVRDSIGDSVWASVVASVGDSIYGQHDASWLAFYAYFSEVCGLTVQTEKLIGLWELSKSAGWALPHEGICWVSERQCVVLQDEQKRIHCETGPAIAYPDGFKIYAIHGTRISDYIIDAPEQITVERIEAEPNAEIRRIMVDRYKNGSELSGAGAYLIDSGSEVLDDDEKYGTLYRRYRMDDTPLIMVRVTNNTVEPDGTVRQFFLRVHPELRPMMWNKQLGAPQAMTARNAVASTWGMRGEEFLPEART